MQHWRKIGRVFCATGQTTQMIAGGRAPVARSLGGGRFRVYFGAYDVEGRGRIFSLEFDIANPLRVLSLRTKPHVSFGQTGFYDDNGIIPSWLVESDGRLNLYTIGFSVKNRVLFDAATGLAVSTDGGHSFRKYDGPVLDRGVDDPCFAASPSVIREPDGSWRMWYVSCSHWEQVGDGFRHFYNIKHKTSTDGLYWTGKTDTCIDFENKYEYAISRPSVLKTKSGQYRMWYSYRGQANVGTYRIGYAESGDGIEWTRKDKEVVLDVSRVGWDSEMICYPFVFKHNGAFYMLYNGNGYGKSGFGLAVLEDT